MSARAFYGAVRRLLLSIVTAVGLAAGTLSPAHAWGPHALVNHVPVVYPNGATALTLNIDQGPLGTRTNAQAVAIVQNAIALWNGVSTSTMRLVIGPQLSTDYTLSNYASIFNNFQDGVNPVIFDTDGSIVSAIYGSGAKSYLLGFAGSAYWTSGPNTGQYLEGYAVLNGSLAASDTTWTLVLAHEIGHFFGLDHSQIDSTQGDAQSNYVLMYPIAYRTLLSLHEDDISAVSTLYPSASAAGVYGQLNGTFTMASGTPILGANIWVKEVSTGLVYSVISDFLTQGNGFFRMNLPAGTYTLNAESLASNFTGASGVGPYATSSSDRSFQAPHPITPVALGGSSPQQIVITAGCLATATFRLDGTGGVTGNCGATHSQPIATTTTLTTSATPVNAGAIVALTATVTGNAPTGSVTFKDSGAVISGCNALSLTAAGTTVCGFSTQVAGVHSIVAVYGGDSANASSTSAALSQVILGSAPPPVNALTNGVPLTGLSAGANAQLSFTIAVPAGASNLKLASAGGTGDATLLVKFGSAPSATTFDCRSQHAGNNETCSFAAPQGGTYYVMLLAGPPGFAGVTLTGTFGTAAANVPPTANFTFTTNGLTANFTDTSTDSDGTIASRSWDFGDGTTSSAANPSKTYTAAGTRNVTLTVTDNAGASKSATRSVAVTSAVTPPSPNTLTNGVPVTGLAGDANTQLVYTMSVPAGATNLRFTLSGGTGDVSLFVRFGTAPTTALYDCRSRSPGNAETCTLPKVQAGTYYVMVRADGPGRFSGVTLTGSYH